jgi:hypothetical protein
MPPQRAVPFQKKQLLPCLAGLGSPIHLVRKVAV